MKSTGDVTAMVIDTGLFIEMARRLGRDFKKVYYCNPSWVTPFPVMNQAYIGSGFPEIEVCLSPFDHFDEIDIFCFFDVGYGRMQDYLISQGKIVWGSRSAENMELDRDGTKRLMGEMNLPVNSYALIQGTENLRAYLKENNNQWVKICAWRGHFETFKAKSFNQVESKLDEIDWELGPLKHMVEFIVEDDLPDMYEGGTDAYCIDGEMPSKILCGREIKDLSYVGKVCNYKSMPEPLTRFDRVMKPVLANYGYRGFYSTEVRIGKDRVPYMIDFCARAGSPPNELYQEMFTNISDIVWQGANGIMIDPRPIAEWGAEVLIHSEWATKHWQPIDVSKEYLQYIKLRNGICVNGKLYTMPQPGGDLPEIGAVVGFGPTLKDAMSMACEIADTVEGFYAECMCDSLEKAEQEIAKAVQLGLWPSF